MASWALGPRASPTAVTLLSARAHLGENPLPSSLTWLLIVLGFGWPPGRRVSLPVQSIPQFLALGPRKTAHSMAAMSPHV